jgi:hypothetical protein
MSPRPSLLLVTLLAAVSAACGGGDSPTSPSPAASTGPTRIIGVSGNLAFGDVPVGSERTATMTISNSGNSALTVTSLGVTGGLADHTAATWTRGTIAPGASQAVTVAFSPTAPGSYSGVVTVNGDQTSGTSTLAISGVGIGTSVAGTWAGNYVVERCDGTGSIQDYFCSSSRGFFPVGTRLPIAVNLTQNGANVSGTVAYGQVSGPVTGNVSAAGVLVLQGTATSAQWSSQITSWSTRVDGRSMEGTVTYNATYQGLPGVAVVSIRLEGVTRR